MQKNKSTHNKLTIPLIVPFWI